MSNPFAPAGAPRKLRLTWNATAICVVGVPVAQEKGLFARHNLDVELINFGGSTDQLLGAIATGKADAGLGMAPRWLTPLEQGFDLRITTGAGGCSRTPRGFPGAPCGTTPRWGWRRRACAARSGGSGWAPRWPAPSSTRHRQPAARADPRRA